MAEGGDRTRSPLAGASLIPALALALMALGSCDVPQTLSDDATSDADVDLTTEVAIFLNTYLGAIENRDTLQLRQMYVGDGRLVWIEEGEIRYRRADAVLDALRSIPAGQTIRTTLKNLEVTGVGRSGALAHASFTTAFGETPDGYTFGGLILFVLERSDGDGAWQIVGGSTASKPPPGGAGADNRPGGS